MKVKCCDCYTWQYIVFLQNDYSGKTTGKIEARNWMGLKHIVISEVQHTR